MSKKLLALGIAMLFMVSLTGCGEDIDPEEQSQAENLLSGLGLASVMTNLDAYSGYSTDGPGIATPPLGWSGPFAYLDIPEGTDTLYYEYFWKVPLDSMGTIIDTMVWLAMPEPDVWGGDTMPWVGLDTWIIGQTRNMIYFHTTFEILDTTRVAGMMKWNWEDTYYEYDYQVSQVNYSSTIDITTSANIGLSAQFRIGNDGSGSETENFAAWNNTTFVRFEFFVRGSQEYDGYYTLLSEGWNVRHYFHLIKYEEA
jgi:hypothetical protein